MDLQGMLWSLPFQGGTARPLTDPLLEPARPDYSPKGGLVAFQAYKGGTFHIWTMHPDGTGLHQLTEGHGDDREPRFSPDGIEDRLRLRPRLPGQLRHLGGGGFERQADAPDLRGGGRVRACVVAGRPRDRVRQRHRSPRHHDPGGERIAARPARSKRRQRERI